MTRASKGKPTKWATRNQVATAAQNWADAVLACRTLGHSWEQSNAVHIRRLRYWQVTYICTRGCGVQKYQEWNERGVPYISWMQYPRDEDGNELYLTDHIGRVAGDIKGVLRIESVTRAGYEDRTGRATEEDLPRSAITRQHVGNGNGRSKQET